ncbi:hypothetical protein C0J52_01632 [Blattella germanica]|nr:hypothetical protein C0J52_01632 [Blattella germanica]
MAFLKKAFLQNNSQRVSRSFFIDRQFVVNPLRCMSDVCVYRSVPDTEADPLDNFTNRLVQEKREKWKNVNSKKPIGLGADIIANNKYNVDQSNNIDVIAINELMRKSIDNKECPVILLLLNICKSKNLHPSQALLQEAASTFSRKGIKSGIEAVKVVCKISDEIQYFTQAEFEHHIAEATWINGNLEEALKIFDNVYSHHPALRRRIRNMTKYLFADCVSNKSEASIVLVTNFAKKYATEYDDFYFLASLWQYLFLSEWFSDNKAANQLLEDYSGLRAIISNKVQFLAATYLAQGNPEVVQRLCEITLRYDMRKQYTYILRSFFDYKCSEGDLKGCTEIMTSAAEVKVSLTNKQHDKYLTLLLNNHSNWLSRRKLAEHQHKQLKVPPFQLKF